MPALRIMSDQPVTRKVNHANHLSDLVMNGIMDGGQKKTTDSQATIPVPKNLRYNRSIFSGGSCSTGKSLSVSGNLNTKDRSKIASSIDGQV